jgi:hypothetical protein
LCLIWYGYLTFNGHTLEQGKKGFLYIFVISAVIITFFAVIWLLTR